MQKEETLPSGAVLNASPGSLSLTFNNLTEPQARYLIQHGAAMQRTWQEEAERDLAEERQHADEHDPDSAAGKSKVLENNLATG